MVTNNDLAYAAGFLDADGSISIVVSRQKYHKLVVQATGRLEPCIDWLEATFGGRIYKEEHKDKDRIYHKWMLLGQYAKDFLKIVLPYLKLKDRQAKLAIEFQSYIQPRYGNRGRGILNQERREEIRQEIIRLNKEGKNDAIYRPAKKKYTRPIDCPTYQPTSTYQ